MRELTSTERETLEKRRAGFEQFVHEATPVLSDFAQRLGLKNPHLIVLDPDAFLDPIDDFMKDQVISDDDRIWAISRMAYFVGQILIRRLEGAWLLNERSDSRFFLQYVVGRFPGTSNPHVTIDPFMIASEFVAMPPGRSLDRTITKAIEEFLTHR